MSGNANLPQKQFRKCLRDNEMAELQKDSTQIYNNNILDCYVDRPTLSFTGAKCTVLNKFVPQNF